jgi:hypothetical protein
MDLLGWLVVVTFLFAAFAIFAARMDTSEDDACDCKRAKFCPLCGKRLDDSVGAASIPQTDELTRKQ